MEEESCSFRAKLAQKDEDESMRDLMLSGMDDSLSAEFMQYSHGALRFFFSKLDAIESRIGEHSVDPIREQVRRILSLHLERDGIIDVIAIHKSWSDAGSVFQQIEAMAGAPWTLCRLRSEECSTVQRAVAGMDYLLLSTTANVPGSQLLVCLDDTEAVPIAVVRGVLAFLSRRAHDIVIKVFLGTPEGADQRILNNVVDRSISPFVRLTSIRLSSPLQHYEFLLRTLLFDFGNLGLLLSSTSLELIQRFFRNQTMSVSSIIQLVRISLARLFWRDPVAIGFSFVLAKRLCGNEGQEEEEDRFLRLLSHKQLESVRRAPSVRSFVETELSDEKSVQKSFVADDEVTRTVAKRMLEKSLHSVLRVRFSVDLFLRCSSKCMGSEGSFQDIADLLFMLPQTRTSAAGEIRHRSLSLFQQTIERVRHLSVEELTTELQDWLSLANREDAPLQQHRNVLSGLLHKLTVPDAAAPTTHRENVGRKRSALPDPPRLFPVEPLESVEPVAHAGHRSKRRRLEALVSSAETLSMAAAVADRSVGASASESVAQQAGQWLSSFLKAHLCWCESMVSWPLSEYFLLQISSGCLAMVEGSHRSAVLRSLLQPHVLLPFVPSIPSHQWPYVSAVYSLMVSEHNNPMVNLYDSFQAFSQLFEGNDESKDSTSSDATLVQAKFFDAVDQLQSLGVIQLTSRKTDHILKTVFS
eukprot:ANDGO_07783.mRNA.1 hypothetical protein